MFTAFLKTQFLKNIKFSVPVPITYCGEIYYYHSCKLESSSHTSTGYAASKSLEISKNKALMEALERLCTPKVDCSYNGSAANFFRWQAIVSAKMEALERDVYIRWALGIIGHETTVHDKMFILRLEPVYAHVEVVLAAHRGFNCVPFGLAAASNFNEARNHAFEELVMSISRHKVGDCSNPQTRYQKLHRHTNLDSFHSKVFGENPFRMGSLIKVPKFGIISHKGPFRWPVNVTTVLNSDIFIWDLSWFDNPKKLDHQNARVVNERFLDKITQLDPIPVG